MAIDDVFDDGEAQAGAQAFAAFLALNPVEAFGKARQMFASDSGAMVGHPQDDEPLAAGKVGGQQRQAHPPRQARGDGGVGGGIHGHLNLQHAEVGRIFQAVVDEVLGHLQQLVPVAGDQGQTARRHRGLQFHAALGGDGGEGVEDVEHGDHHIDAALRGDVFVQLDAAQRHQIVDQPGHASGLGGHDAEKPLAGHRVVLGVAAQGLDEAGEGGQRRAQLVASVGQEVGAHALVAAAVCLVAHDQQGQEGAVGGLRQGTGEDAPEPVLGAAALIGRLVGHAAEQAFVHRFQNPGVTDGRHQGHAFALYTEEFPGSEVGEGHPAVGEVQGVPRRDHQHRVRQAFHHGGEPRPVALGGGGDFGQRCFSERHHAVLQGGSFLSAPAWAKLRRPAPGAKPGQAREPGKPVVRSGEAQRRSAAARGLG